MKILHSLVRTAFSGIFLFIITALLPGLTYIIPIHGDIEPFRLVFLRRSIEEAEEPDRIIFDINTFGGRVDTALQIATLIGSLSETETLAFISAGAESLGVSWSAGALISFSANSIYMASGTSMGAAAPVYQSTEGMTMAPEKTVSAVRGQMAALAEKNGYPTAAALGMVDMDVIVREVTVNNQVLLIQESELESLKEKVQAEGGTFTPGPVISDKGKLLTLTAGEMERYGISSGTVFTRAQLLEKLGLQEEDIVLMEETRADRLVALYHRRCCYEPSHYPGAGGRLSGNYQSRFRDSRNRCYCRFFCGFSGRSPDGNHGFGGAAVVYSGGGTPCGGDFSDSRLRCYRYFRTYSHVCGTPPVPSGLYCSRV